MPGIDVTVVADAAALQAAIAEAVESRSCGLVLVEEEMMRELGGEAREQCTEMNVPLVVEVPGRLEWPAEERVGDDGYVAGLIRRAVGYTLSLKL